MLVKENDNKTVLDKENKECTKNSYIILNFQYMWVAYFSEQRKY